MGRNKRTQKPVSERTRHGKMRKEKKIKESVMKAVSAHVSKAKARKREASTTPSSLSIGKSKIEGGEDASNTIQIDTTLATYLRNESGIKRFNRGPGSLLKFDEKLDVIKRMTILLQIRSYLISLYIRVYLEIIKY